MRTGKTVWLAVDGPVSAQVLLSDDADPGYPIQTTPTAPPALVPVLFSGTSALLS